MGAGMILVTERAAGGGPILRDGDEGESIAHVAKDVGIVLGDAPVQQPGTLYITSRRLIWLSDDDVRKGYGVDFLSVSMHAISRDTEVYAQPCIYTQIERGDDESEYEEVEDMEEPAEELLESENHKYEDVSAVAEMRLVPADSSVLDFLFQVLCDCALLNPDPEGEQEGEADWYFNVNEVMGRSIGEGNHSDNLPDISELQLHDPRFEDAEEELGG